MELGTVVVLAVIALVILFVWIARKSKSTDTSASHSGDRLDSATDNGGDGGGGGGD